MLTLAEAMILSLLQQQTTQGLFGKPKIPFGAYLEVSGYVYESAALISRALVEKSSVLEQIIAAPDAPGSALTYLREVARARRESIPEQTSFAMLIMESEMNRIGLSMSGLDSLKKTGDAMKKKFNVVDIKPLAEMHCLEGFGFGLEFPEETRDMYRNTYEEFDEENWKSAHKAGLNIPENPTVYPLEQRENDILTLVSEYVHEFRPELEDSLGLKHLLSS